MLISSIERENTFAPAVERRALPVPAAEICVVAPTYNECGNVRALVDKLREALADVTWEAIFVDDNSPDGTAAALRNLAQTDGRVRCIRRFGRRGLSSACTEGMLATSASYVAVIDADLQHDPGKLREMLEVLRAGEADLVIASRYIPGGGIGEWDETRAHMSVLATRLARIVMKQSIADPMSGYFMLKRETFEACANRLSTLGFKILLDIVASSPSTLRVREIPLVFGKRLSGESKLSTNVAWEFLLLIGDKLFGRFVPVRFVAFGMVGAAGAAVHFAALTLSFKTLALPFTASQTIAVVSAMLFNFTVNNVLTYSDASLHGWRWLKGLTSFLAICGIGAVANVGIATYLFGQQTSWPIAAVAGILVGAVWNYAVTAKYTWKSA